MRLPNARSRWQVVKEQAWLPRLEPRLPLPIPTLHGAGRPSDSFTSPWSVYDWIEGRTPERAEIRDDEQIAADLAGFLPALRSADTEDAPGPGPHSAFRGGPPEHWDEEMHDLVHRLSGRERELARAIWSEALVARFDGTPAWVHGDVAIANLLVLRDGRLSAVIDFGCSAVGDPACDTVIRWTQLRARARRTFVQDLDLDDGTWARGRGWALWKGLIMLTNRPLGQAQFGRHVLDEVFAEG